MIGWRVLLTRFLCCECGQVAATLASKYGLASVTLAGTVSRPGSLQVPSAHMHITPAQFQNREALEH